MDIGSVKIDKLNNIRAQIGPTITWMAALLIIVFILAIFTVASLALAKVKKTNVESFISTESSSDNEIFLNYIMKKPLGENKDTIEKEIYNWADGDKSLGQKIRDNVKSFFAQVPINYCYLFIVTLDGASKATRSIESEEYDRYFMLTTDNSIKVESFAGLSDNLMKKSIVKYLVGENHDIKINFYSGGC